MLDLVVAPSQSEETASGDRGAAGRPCRRDSGVSQLSAAVAARPRGCVWRPY